jgi:hypothetical protein
MAHDENNHECQSLVTDPTGTVTQHSRAGMSGMSEPDFQFLLEDYLEPRKWHKLYAEALLEIDPDKTAALIARAESAILSRYLELRIFPTPIEEGRDLDSAIRVLSRLRISASHRLQDKPSCELASLHTQTVQN